jgi:hypothetical protein
MAQNQQSIPIRYVDMPELTETFADSVHNMVWDGQTLRVEFCVTRYPEHAAAAGAEAKQQPTCRLVLTAPGVAALFNRLQQTVAALTAAGVVAKHPTPQGSA